MIRSHTLLPHEQQLVKAMQEQAQKTSADIGILMLQLEAVRKLLDLQQERQRMLINVVACRLGVSNCREARIEGTNLIIETADEEGDRPPVMSRPNGLEAAAESHA